MVKCVLLKCPQGCSQDLDEAKKFEGKNRKLDLAMKNTLFQYENPAAARGCKIMSWFLAQISFMGFVVDPDWVFLCIHSLNVIVSYFGVFVLPLFEHCRAFSQYFE